MREHVNQLDLQEYDQLTGIIDDAREALSDPYLSFIHQLPYLRTLNQAVKARMVILERSESFVKSQEAAA